MTFRLSKLFLVSVLVLSFGTSILGQITSPGADQWVEIKDDKLGFSIQVPSDYLVDNDMEKTFMLAPVLASLPRVVDVVERPRILAYKGNASFEVSVFQLRIVSSAKDHLQYFIDPKADDFQDFQAGHFVGRKTNYETEKSQYTVIMMATKNRVVRISASAAKSDNENYEKFVLSLRLNGNFLFKSDASKIPVASSTILLPTLKTSSEVLEALKSKTKAPDQNVIRGSSAVASQLNESDRKYSRPLIVLRQPNAVPSSATIGQKIRGVVKLRITFLASGKLGEIVVLSELPSGLTESALDSARNIVFLPAEIDGKQVDTTRIISYGFDIN